MGEKGEKWFWTGVDRVMNIVLLGFLWLICSLPVITIGASSAALNVAMSDYVRGDCHSVMKSFFTAFRQHWPLATKIWLIHLIVIAVLTFAVPVAVFFLLPGFLPALPGLIAYLDWQILPKMFQKAKFKKGNREQNRAVRKQNQ